MPKSFDTLLTVLCAAVILTGVVLFMRPEPQAQGDSLERAIEVVLRAQQFIGQSDIANAVQDFDRETGFNADGIYLFVLDADGQNIYHAADRTLIGTDFAQLTDLDGRPFGRKLITDTAADGVWHSYRARNGWRLTYARKTAKGYIIAAGFTASPQWR